MKEKLRGILRKLRLIDYKWSIIIFLALKNIGMSIAFYSIFIMGIGIAPSENPMIKQGPEIGEQIGKILSVISIKTFNAGYELGIQLDPWNNEIAQVMGYIMIGIPVSLTIFILGSLISNIIPERWIKQEGTE